MERLRPQESVRPKTGISLRELSIPIIKEREGKWIPPVSDRIVWLNDSMENETFWLELNRHMAEDDDARQKHSIGGIFFRQQGKKLISYTEFNWNQLFSTLDHFLKEFDMRATEFIFRDFEPENTNHNLARTIDSTRQLGFDKYPRIRRLYWDNYQELLETSNFWRGLSLDLENLPEPIATYTFFEQPKVTWTQKKENSDVQTVIEQTFKRQFHWPDRHPKRSLRFEYYNLAQLVKDIFSQNPRTFLLNYNPQEENKNLKKSIEEAKRLIESKLLPIREKTEPMVKMNRHEFEETIQSKEFWFSLAVDVENHANSENQAYSLSQFLRYYNQGKNDIDEAKPGSYARFVTLYLNSLKGLRRKMIKPSRKLAHYLMWEFKPSEEAAPLVLQAKASCAEMFPQDCLFVTLQTPEFWAEFQKDAKKVQGKHSLYTFLRYFGQDNLTCNGRRYKRGSSKYQRLLHRAYHKEEKFTQFISQLGIKNITNFKDGIVELFWLTSPEKIKPLLKEKFPMDFDSKEKEKRLNSAKLLSEAKKLI
jgi:hypothetical protein